jgi:hypothetical protein
MTDYPKLLDAVDALTKPVTVAEWISDGDRRTLFRRTDPSLLEQLAARVGSSLPPSAGSRTSSRALVPIDVGALTLLEEIDGMVRSWLLDFGARPGRLVSTGEALRSWFVFFQAGQREPEVVSRHEGRVWGWVQQIEDVVDPPTVEEVTRPCPSCGVRRTVQGSGEDAVSVSALRAVWRASGAAASFAECRACGRKWLGLSGMRALRVAIDDVEMAS